MESMKGIQLRGIRITCPKCKESGIITTRWIKGPPIKPVYVLHRSGKSLKRLCLLSESQAIDAKKKVSIKDGDIRRLVNNRRPFILFSGGKDSLATLEYLIRIPGIDIRRFTAIFVDTTAGIPENVQHVENVCKQLKIKLKIVKPKVDFFSLAEKWGIPSHGYRWCCRELKIKPIADYLGKIKEPKIVFDGIRAAESNIRKSYIPIWYHPTFECLSISPIFYWSDERVISTISNNGLSEKMVNSILNTSTECWCGAYKKEGDFRRLYELSPRLFGRLVELEEKSKSGFTFVYRDGKHISLRELKQSILSDVIALST